MVGSSLPMSGKDYEMISEGEKEEGETLILGWEVEVGVPEKEAPTRGRDRLLGSGSEVEARSCIHDKCQEKGGVDHQVGGEADHLHGQPGHDHQSGRAHREDLMTGGVCIEGLPTEGRRHVGPLTEEVLLWEDEFSLPKEEGPLWRDAGRPKQDDCHLLEEQGFTRLHLSGVVPGKGSGAGNNREEVGRGVATPGLHPATIQEARAGRTIRDQVQVLAASTASLILDTLNDRWNSELKIMSAGDKPSIHTPHCSEP